MVGEVLLDCKHCRCQEDLLTIFRLIFTHPGSNIGAHALYVRLMCCFKAGVVKPGLREAWSTRSSQLAEDVQKRVTRSQILSFRHVADFNLRLNG